MDDRLSGEAIFPAAIRFIKAIKANAIKCNLDPEKIATWGDSAGGNLSALAGTSSDSSPKSQSIGGNITQNVEQTKRANPENYSTAADPYFFIQHGSVDPNVPPQQSIDFAQKRLQFWVRIKQLLKY